MSSESTVETPSKIASTDDQRRRWSRTILADIVRFADTSVIVMAAVIAFYAYPISEPVRNQDWPYYLLVTALGALASTSAFKAGRLYTFSTLRQPMRLLGRMAALWSLTLLLLIALGFLIKVSENYSRGWSLTWWGLGLTCLFVNRAIVWRLLNSGAVVERTQQRIALVGASVDVARLQAQLNLSPSADIHIVGSFSWDSGGDQLLKLLECGRQRDLDAVVLAEGEHGSRGLSPVLQQLQQLPVDVVMALGIDSHSLPVADIERLNGVPIVPILRRPLRDWDAILKRSEDIVLSVAILTLISPLMLLVALAIKLETRGPIIFKQVRFGFNNKPILVYKFRSMYVDRGDATGKARTTKNDPRVTRVGRFIRRTSIDELPQFVNVLEGKMSIVGPRAHAIEMLAGERLIHEVVDGYYTRHKVKPGITGWAQVNGLRGELDTIEKGQHRIDHDLYYIENWSLPFDLYIILLTVWSTLRDPAAY